MITTITKAYIRHYSDTGQVTAYVEFLDENAKRCRIEGSDQSKHMEELFKRAKRENIQILVERW